MKWTDATQEQIDASAELQYARQRAYYRVLFATQDGRDVLADILADGGVLCAAVPPEKEQAFTFLVQDRFRILGKAGISSMIELTKALATSVRRKGAPEKEPKRDILKV